MKRLAEVTHEIWEEVNPHNKQFVEEFLSQGHLSPQTLKQYRSGLMQFFAWVKDNRFNKPIYELKPRDALLYQNYLINQGLSSSAIKFKRSAVSSLCGYIEIYYSDDFPMFRNIYNKNIPNPPSAKRHEKVPLTKEQFETLVSKLEEKGDWQKVAYLLYTYSTGCRREESRQLLKEAATYDRYKDKEGKDKPFYMTHSIRAKGRGREGKVRKFTFDERAMEAMKKWLELRGDDDCEYMFVAKGKGGEYQQISANMFNHWCTNIFSKMLGVRVHPHLLRSSRATHAVVEEGKDIKAVQKLLGHASTETTEIYVVRDDSEDLDDLF
ncbi:tyrosine-type recombinase/integrase [Bacillus toyonensis]|uniref:tyrosine-type recombinase/integrase n=1 Tax=Bacillus toyonensis TaxID=155322 RepID=UPI001298A608